MSVLKDETPLPLLRFKEVLGEYVGCVTPYCFIRRADKEMIGPNSFNMEYNRLVNVCEGLGTGKPAPYRDNAAKAAINSPELEIVRRTTYRPDGPAITDDRAFNMWTDPKIEPLKGEPSIFLEHINYLIPVKAERDLLLQWLAWITQNPDQKVQYAILIVGRGGTGKSWVGSLMERIFGADNVVMIDREERLKSQFNRIFENKRFVFVHEMPKDDTAAVIEKVKGLITQNDFLIEGKGVDVYRARNLTNLIAVANDDIKIDLTNRRWAVIRATDDPVGADERGQGGGAEHRKYYTRLWDVIPRDGAVTDEARRVLNFLRNYSLAKFDPNVAPLTAAKQEAAETDDQVFARLAAAYRDSAGPFRFNLLTAEDAAKFARTSADRTLTGHLLELGCRKVRRKDGKDVQVTFADGRRPRIWAINPKVAAYHVGTSPEELVRLYEEERARKAEYAKPAVKPAPDDDPLPPGDWELDDIGDDRTLN